MINEDNIITFASFNDENEDKPKCVAVNKGAVVGPR